MNILYSNNINQEVFISLVEAPITDYLLLVMITLKHSLYIIFEGYPRGQVRGGSLDNHHAVQGRGHCIFILLIKNSKDGAIVMRKPSECKTQRELSCGLKHKNPESDKPIENIFLTICSSKKLGS